jgi:hypothetical protein
MKRRHGGILVAEAVLSPDGAFTLGAVNRVYEAVGSGFFADGALNIRVREESRRHAGPEREDDEGEEIADGHGATAGGVELGSCGWAGGFVGFDGRGWKGGRCSGCGVEIKPD